MKERLCKWCNKPFEHHELSVKFCSFLCRDFQRGREIGEEWAAKQPTKEKIERLEKIRRSNRVGLDKEVGWIKPKPGYKMEDREDFFPNYTEDEL